MPHQILDQAADVSGAEHYRISELYNPPGYAKTASHDARCGDAGQLPPAAYALPQRQLYAAHTKAATWWSAAFLEAGREQMPPAVYAEAKSSLEKFAQFHQILPDVQELWRKMAADAEPAAIPDSYYMLVRGQTREYPLRNPKEVKVAAAWFEKYGREFDFATRCEMAEKLLHRLEALKVVTPQEDLINKTAGYGFCTRDDMANLWRQRAAMVKKASPAMADEAEQMALVVLEESAAAVAVDRPMQLQMAKLADQFDEKYDLKRHYGQGISYPEDVLFQITQKTASDLANSVVETPTGRVYEKAALGRLSSDLVAAWLGQDVADHVSVPGFGVDAEKMAEYLSATTQPDAEMFDSLAKVAGIAPVARTPKSAARRIDESELRLLAGLLR